MQIDLERAKLFNSFDALKGFKEALKLQEKIIEEKKNLSSDLKDELNNKLNKLNKGDRVLIKYYYDLEYIESIGVIKKIDIIYKKIYLLNTVIDIDDIFDICLLN